MKNTIKIILLLSCGYVAAATEVMDGEGLAGLSCQQKALLYNCLRPSKKQVKQVKLKDLICKIHEVCDDFFKEHLMEYGIIITDEVRVGLAYWNPLSVPFQTSSDSSKHMIFENSGNSFAFGYIQPTTAKIRKLIHDLDALESNGSKAALIAIMHVSRPNPVYVRLGPPSVKVSSLCGFKVFSLQDIMCIKE